MVEIITRFLLFIEPCEQHTRELRGGDNSEFRAFFINGNMLRGESGVSEFEGWEFEGMG